MTASDIPTRRIGIFGLSAIMIAMIAAAGISDINKGVICQNEFNPDGNVTGVECKERPSQLMEVINSQTFYIMGAALAAFIGLDKIDNMVVTRKNHASEPTSEVRDI